MSEEIKKVYGTSILDQHDDTIDDTNFKDIVYTDEDIQSMRAELKDTNETKVLAKISTDALSGVTVSSKSNEFEDLDRLEQQLNEKDIRGKTLPEQSIKLIENLTGIRVSDVDTERMAKFFEEHDSDADLSPRFISDDIDKIFYALGDEIHSFITNLSDDSDEIADIARRLTGQIYGSYRAALSYNDDMKELAVLTRKVKIAANDYEELKELNEPTEETLDNLMQSREWIQRYMEIRNGMDDRNRRLKQDYRIDDIDTKTVDEVKEALEDALSMKTIYNFLNTNPKLLYTEYNNSKECYQVIKNWITSIKNDNNTLYTFPTNDYYTIRQTIEEVSKFIYSALLAETCRDHPLPDSEIGDAGKYYVLNGVLTQNDIEKLMEKSKMILYIIAKTFKYKKLTNVYQRRVLSYTLDMMSKLGKDEYRLKFYELANMLYTYLGKIN